MSAIKSQKLPLKKSVIKFFFLGAYEPINAPPSREIPSANETQTPVQMTQGGKPQIKMESARQHNGLMFFGDLVESKG